MAVISVSTIESPYQVVFGIPKTLAIETNMPCVIFYTLDGSLPTLSSNQYIEPINLPIDQTNLTVNIMATDGVNTSAVITKSYSTGQMQNVRLPRAGTTANAQTNLPSGYPFGNNNIQPNAQFVNPADAGITVNNPNLPGIPTGFDGYGHPTGITNQPYNLQNYAIKYNTTDFINQPHVGPGTFPKNFSVAKPSSPPNQSDLNAKLFNPRAFVIFQDASKESPNDPPQINKMYFSLEDPEKVRDGNYFHTTGLSSPPTSGTFLRSYYNPRTNMITYYYLDTWTNKWLISTAPFNPGMEDFNLSGAILAGARGSKHVFEWVPYKRQVIF